MVTRIQDGATLNEMALIAGSNGHTYHNARFRQAAMLTEAEQREQIKTGGESSLLCYASVGQRLVQCSIQDATDLGNLNVVDAEMTLDRCLFSGGACWSDPNGAGVIARHGGVCLNIGGWLRIHRSICTRWTQRLFNSAYGFVSLTNSLVLIDSPFAIGKLENSWGQCINNVFIYRCKDRPFGAPFCICGPQTARADIQPQPYDRPDQGMARRFYHSGNVFIGWPDPMASPYCIYGAGTADAGPEYYRTQPYQLPFALTPAGLVIQDVMRNAGAQPRDAWDAEVIEAAKKLIG